MKLAWTIAGSDPSGGAGSQADQRAFTALGVHCCPVVSAIAAQGFATFVSAEPVAIAAQLAALSDARMPQPQAIKIGMLGNEANTLAVAAYLAKQKNAGHRPPFVVLDPVFKASSGGTLADPQAIRALVEELLPHADLFTPNVPEAAHLLGRNLDSAAVLPAAASALQRLGARRVLLKGGHLPGAEVRDYYADGEQGFWLVSPRLPQAARGTGCTLASAIAAHVVHGKSLADSLVLARAFVSHGLRTSIPTDCGPAILGSGAELTAEDMPWLLPTAEAERPQFPSCGPAPLGFYPIVDRAAWVRRCVEQGATTVQLRIKDLGGEALIHELRTAIAYCRHLNVRLFINDHWRLAIELGAYGVHLGQEDLIEADFGAIAQAGLRLGLSTHCYEEAARAHGLRPSYIALGPIFPTTCKSLRFGPHGLGQISTWRRLFPYPVVAIGGLTHDLAKAAMDHGADGVAVISDVVLAPDPELQMRRWLERCGQDAAK